MNDSKAWDKVSEKFNTFGNEVDPDSADNIEIAWPVILKIIKRNIRNPQNQRALDYGCGTGMFCNELIKNNFSVTGMDTSGGMIRIAKKHAGKQISFFVGDSQKALKLSKNNKKFKLVSSIMVFQFIANIRKTMKSLSECLETNGLLVFAVHRPEYLKAWGIKNKMPFGPKVFARSSADYTKILKPLGLKTIGQYEPEFTKKFIKKYKPAYPTSIPEFLILAYKKI